MSKTQTKTKSKKGSWPEIATIRTGDKGSYLKFADNVDILVDGVKLEMNKSRTANLVDPSEEVEKLISLGVIGEDKAEARREQVASTKEWLKKKVVVPPPMKD